MSDLVNGIVADLLGGYDRLEMGVFREIVAHLGVSAPLAVLDAGCGQGAAALHFAAAGAAVTAVDIDARAVGAAGRLLAASPFEARVLEGDLTDLSFAEASFGLAWCGSVLHHLADKQAAVRELRRVLRPGGQLAIREGGLPLQLLPFDLGLGEPGLQDRLRVADNRWFARMTRATLPEAAPYPFGWPQLLHGGGFERVSARTFVLELLSPFDDAQRAFVLELLRRPLARDAGEYGPLLGREDRDALERLLDAASPHFVLGRADLHLRYGVSVYSGYKP